MTADQQKALDIARLKKLSENPKDLKCPGVVRKLRRKIRKSEQ